MKTVKELKKEIDKVMLPNYTYETNLSCSEQLIYFNTGLAIGAKLEKVNNEMVYKFIVDTQFKSDNEITYDELVIIKNVIEILETNRKFVLRRLKKYTVIEYENELKEKQERSEKILEALEAFILKSKN